MCVRAKAAEATVWEEELVVRNTFLSTVGSSRTAPRSASVPAGARLAGRLPRGKDPLHDQEEPAVSEAASTQACSEVDASVGEASADRASPSGREGHLQAQLPGVRHVSSDSGDSPVEASGGYLVLALEEILAGQGQLRCRERKSSQPTRLNSHARAWTPGEVGAWAQPQALRPDLLWQVRGVVQAAALALGSADSVLGVDVAEEGAKGWTIIAHLSPQELSRQRECVLGIAKEALLQGACASQNVYVLGHHWRPFMATPLGFCARLAAVPEPKKACWSLLDNGVCPAGGNCRWEHPPLQTNISIMVKVREQ